MRCSTISSMQSATLRPAAETQRPTTHGLAALSLEHRDGRTRLAHARTRPPLLVQRALYPDESAPDMAHVFLSNPTGGLFAGDLQQIKVAVGRGAKAHVTTQSATKIYTMEQGSAEQRVVLSVSSGGYLEYLPDPLIPYRGASFDQDFAITVEPGGALLWWDVITPGRVAMGESFRYRRLHNRLAVYHDSRRAVYREAFDLAPEKTGPIGIGLLGLGSDGIPDSDQLTLGSMLIVCDESASLPILDLLRVNLRHCAGTHADAALLPDRNGLGVKVIGSDCAAVQEALRQAWSFARCTLLGTDPPSSRKY